MPATTTATTITHATTPMSILTSASTPAPVRSLRHSPDGIGIHTNSMSVQAAARINASVRTGPIHKGREP